MPAHDAEIAWLGITQIEAQSMLLQMTIQDYPHMKQNKREKLHREIHSKAYPNNVKRTISMRDIMRLRRNG